MILIADHLENRRVIEGSLGCPNCRDRFPVQAGFGDLRPPPRSTLDEVPAVEPPASPSAMEVAALLGLTDGPGNVALIGNLSGHAAALAGLVPGVEFIGIAPGLRRWEEGEGVSRLNAGASLPFSDGSLRGVGLVAEGSPTAAANSSMAGELGRVVARDGRIAVWSTDGSTVGATAGATTGATAAATAGPAVREWEEALRAEGLDVLASEETAVVLTKAAP